MNFNNVSTALNVDKGFYFITVVNEPSGHVTFGSVTGCRKVCQTEYILYAKNTNKMAVQIVEVMFSVG
jgi:hypothetical protein